LVRPFNFAALYAFAWRHERCHLVQAMKAFPNIPDPRTKLEAIVRRDTLLFHAAAGFDPAGFNDADLAILNANTIDTTANSQPYTFWSRDSTNAAWFRRTFEPAGHLLPEC